MDLKEKIRNIRDFPKPGIVFRDITTLLNDAEAFEEVIDRFCLHFKKYDITKVGVVESRGFIFGGPIALSLGVGIVPIRKKGKLPFETIYSRTIWNTAPARWRCTLMRLVKPTGY